MSAVVVVGSGKIHFTAHVERAREQGETIFGRDLLVSFGGKGANQAVAARRAGADVMFIGKVGQDRHGEEIRKNLETVGIDGAGLISDAACGTGVAFILVDPSGGNQIVVVPGCNYHLTPEELESRDQLLGGAIRLVRLETPRETVHWVLRRAKEKRMRTILNPAPATPLRREDFSLVDLLTPNETEASALPGVPVKDLNGAKKAGDRLLEMGCGDVIMTLGVRGALWVGKGGARHFPAFSVRPVDSTGAGDAFNGALAAALAEGRTLEKAIPFADLGVFLAPSPSPADEPSPSRPGRPRGLSSGQ